MVLLGSKIFAYHAFCNCFFFLAMITIEYNDNDIHILCFLLCRWYTAKSSRTSNFFVHDRARFELTLGRIHFALMKHSVETRGSSHARS